MAVCRRIAAPANARWCSSLLQDRPATATIPPPPVRRMHLAARSVLEMSADILPVVVLGTGVAVAGVVSWLMLGDESIAVNARIDEHDVTYLCEGQRSVLCREHRRKSGSYILQLSKAHGGEQSSSSTNSLVDRAEFQHALADHCFDKCVISKPEVALLTPANVRAIDAAILSGRPQQDRQVQLAVDESVENRGRVSALRYPNLFESPFGSSSSSRAAPVDAKKSANLKSPLLALELRLGCGFAEVDGLPSRSALMLHASGRKPQHDPATLFSGTRRDLTSVLTHFMAEGSHCRLFMDGQPIHPVTLPGRASGNQSLASDLGSCSLQSIDNIADATAALLESCQRGRGFLASIQRLQCFAAGEESEKLAGRLLQELQTHGGADAVAALRGRDLMKDALSRAARGGIGKAGVRSHERQGRSLVATAKWGPSEVVAVQQWLALFLLGRAALDARVLFSFVSLPQASAEANRENERRLRALRFAPLADIMPGEALSSNVWACMTVTGLEPRDPDEIARCTNELEDLVRHYTAANKETSAK